jgi:4a-hydroxytetrahydrobiopterin dehydratase
MAMSSSDLVSKHCKPCKEGTPPLGESRVKELLAGLSGWKSEGGAISKTYKFENYYQTMAFVNATAWISHREDHHPDLAVGYNKCEIRYSKMILFAPQRWKLCRKYESGAVAIYL